MPLPKLPSSRTSGTTGTLPSDTCLGFRAPATEDPDLGIVLNEFDIKIERIATAQNGQVTHEADLDKNSYS